MTDFAAEISFFPFILFPAIILMQRANDIDYRELLSFETSSDKSCQLQPPDLLKYLDNYFSSFRISGRTLMQHAGISNSCCSHSTARDQSFRISFNEKLKTLSTLKSYFAQPRNDHTNKLLWRLPLLLTLLAVVRDMKLLCDAIIVAFVALCCSTRT